VNRAILALVVIVLAGRVLPAGDDKPQVDPEAEKLVEKLGSKSFAERQAAESSLRALGAKAKPAVIAGTKSSDAEIARRSETVLKQIRADQHQALVAGKAEWPGPEWKRFIEIVGDTTAARKVFAEIVDDDRRAAVVEKAGADATTAAGLYTSELARVQEAGRKAFAGFIGQPVMREGPSPIRQASQKAVPPGDVALLLFLGSFPLPDRVTDPPDVEHIVRASFIDSCGGPLKEQYRKLYVAWLDRRRDPKALNTGLEAALYGAIPEAVQVARRVVGDTKAPASVVGTALLVLGNHGSLDDLAKLAAFREDTRAFWEHTTVQKIRLEIQVRDVAAAMSLNVRGQEFGKFGFEHVGYVAWWVGPAVAPFKAIHWFKTADDREAGLKKAWEWLDKQPKPVGSSTLFGSKSGDERELAGMKLCWCPAGKFKMGSPPDEPERRPGEDQVEVTLTNGFWTGKYEVTQGQWKRVVGDFPRKQPAGEGDDFPVVEVNHAEAEAFCKKLTEQARKAGGLPDGWEFRLPTEAQWEYACRAGTSTATAFGDKLSSKQANFMGKPYNGAEEGPSLKRATKVGSYPANAWGLHDTHGNVFEWCRDWFHDRLPGGEDPDLSAVKGSKNRDGSYSRVRRGGAWSDDGWPCRSAFRVRFEPERRSDHIGFRVVLSTK
jgi:sulfatase modifying factor 1